MPLTLISQEAEDAARHAIDAAYKIHVALGPGLLESVYETCMHHELSRRGLSVERQVSVPVVFEGLRLETGFRADMIVDHCLLLELKSVDEHQKVFEAQLLTYLKLTGLRIGHLINFNVPVIKQGIKRMVL